MFPWPAFLSYIVVTAFTPGPNNIASMSHGTKYGFRQTLPFILGIYSALLLIMSVCAFFTSALFRIMPVIKTPMLFVGAGYILWLAWKLVQSDGQLKAKSSGRGSFQTGFWLQLVNPKLYIYTITALSGFILPYYSRLIVLLGFVLILATTAVTSCLLWASFGSLFRNLFARHTKLVNYTMAALLVYSAVALFF